MFGLIFDIGDIAINIPSIAKMRFAMKIAILLLDDFFDTGFTVTRDALRIANKFSVLQLGGEVNFDVSVIGVKKKVRAYSGDFSINVMPVTASMKPDVVIVPALAASSPDLLVPALQRKDVVAAKEHLKKWHKKGVKIAASCIGSFILADAGILDQCEATTTWWLAPFFRQRYPNVHLNEDRMLVESGQVVTTGALMGHLDLALWLINRASPQLASIVSRYMLANLRTDQAPYIIPNHLAKADPLVASFEKWARINLKEGFSLPAAAKALATSTRTLHRRCEEVLGKSPRDYFQDLRVEHARHLLLSSSLDLDSIAAEVGYENGYTLSRLLRDKLGRGIREIRATIN